MGLCPTLWGTSGSVFFPWTTGISWGQGGPGNISLPGSACSETGLSGITCMLGTTRCLESSVLLSMRLLQSSRSKVLREKVGQQSGSSSFSIRPGGFIYGH